VGPWAWGKAPTPGPFTTIAYFLFKMIKQHLTVQSKKNDVIKKYIHSFINNLKDHVLSLKKIYS
jgi:hypothetical protein